MSRLHSFAEGRGIAAFLFCILPVLALLIPVGSLGAEEPGTGVRYEVDMKGVPEEDLKELLEASSDAVGLMDRPPATVNLLRRRVRNDVPRLTEALRSYGYFQAGVSFEIVREEKPVKVVFTIEPGPVFELNEVRMERTDDSDTDVELPDPEEIGLETGSPFRAEHVLEAKEDILTFLRNQGFPSPRLTGTEVTVDHATRDVSVVYSIKTGPEAKFGETTITGLESVDQEYARGFILWEEGQPYDRSLIDRTREKVIRSGLFSMVRINPEESVREDGRLPMTVEMTERKHRLFKIGTSYTTDFGLGFSGGWEHRNLLGEGENLSIEASIDQVFTELTASFRKPEFFRDDQQLVIQSTLVEEDAEAFTSRSFRNTAKVERTLTKYVTVGAGVGYDFIREETDDETETFGLFSLPLSANFRTTDDILDPGKGMVLDLLVTPYQETLGDRVRYLKYNVLGSTYFQLLEQKRLILALQGRYGQIMGAETTKVPNSERFYAGGGGSVRGYPFQSLSPLDEDEDPVGGHSVVELSAELRLKMTETFGLAAFVDGGRAYESDIPNLGEELFWGVGMGLRYYTAIGPLRLDVAFPLEEREGVDDAFQVYVSIGQSF